MASSTSSRRMRGHHMRDCRAKVRAGLPSAVELVCDNFDFFVIGFSPTRRPSDAIVSLAAHRRGVNLCFLQRGRSCPIRTGSCAAPAKVVRSVALESAGDLDRDDVRALIEAALELARTCVDRGVGPAVVIQSVSAKQRTRR